MKISEYIAELERIKGEVGDVEVETDGYDGVRPASAPRISFKKILTGRESKQRFWNTWESEERKGELVCRI